jgi:hypothetical protein
MMQANFGRAARWQSEDENKFTIQNAIDIQTSQFLEWQSILLPEKARVLGEWLAEGNKKAIALHGRNSTDTNGIKRGTEISNFVHNSLMVHSWDKA